MKFTDIFWKILFLGGVVLLACGATYYVTSYKYDKQVEELRFKVKSLEEKELKARVTQRVSVQLEDIARQQTIIADSARVKAEKQFRIAENEKAKAEMARSLAEENRNKALASAREAEEARQESERQKEKATENMLAAQNARDRADTLLYNSLSNSLALSSLRRDQVGDTVLARLLSYAAWHYNNLYEGKTSKRNNIYKAMLKSSGSFFEGSPGTTGLLGNVRRLRTFKGDYTLGVTDYGELFYSNGSNQRVVRKGNWDMRDFLSEGLQKNHILCSSGQILLSVDMRGIENGAKEGDIKDKGVVNLPKDVWHKILGTDTLMYALGEKNVAWVKNEKLFDSKNFPCRLTAMGLQGDCLHIFGWNGEHYVSTRPGECEKMSLAGIKKEDHVTAYRYDNLKELQILGLYSGKILVLDKFGNYVTELVGHTAPITDIHVMGDVLGSASYDCTLKLWDLQGIGSLMIPVEVTLNEWPLCFSVGREDFTIWVGMEDGYISHFCSDIERNAVSTKNSLTRDFTDEEWNFYIGPEFQRVKFYDNEKSKMKNQK